MGVDENNMDYIEEKEINEILDVAISEMLGRIKRSLEEEIAVKPLPPPPPMVPIPIPIREEPQKLAKVLEDFGVQTDAVAMDGEKKMQYQINIQEHARPACSPLHINLSLPPHSCQSTTPASPPAPVKSTAEPGKGPKSTENVSVQTVKIGDGPTKKKKKQTNVQRQAKPGVSPIHINVTMPHIYQPTAASPTSDGSQPDPAAEQKKEPALFKEIGVQSGDIDTVTKEEVPAKTTPAAPKPEQEKKPKLLKEVGVQCDDTEADTKEDVPPKTTPAAPKPDMAPEQKKKPKLFREVGVQCDDTKADTKEDVSQPITLQLVLQEAPETIESEKEGKRIKTVSVQTEETAADREKPVLYDIKIQEHARPENTPLRINFNLPAHTCPKSVEEPTSDKKSQETSDSQKEKEDTGGVGVQTVETGDDRPKPVQFKINIQEHERPATSPLHITVNQPRHTCSASTAQSPPDTPQPAKKAKIMKDLSVQTGENGAEKTSPDQYQFNMPKQSHLGSSPIRIYVDVPPHDCQSSSSTVKRPSARDSPDSSQPPKRPKQVGDVSVQTDAETSGSKSTQPNKPGHVYINVKVPPHVCSPPTAKPNSDKKNTQAIQVPSESGTFDEDEDMQTNDDDSTIKQIKTQIYMLPDGTILHITPTTSSQTAQQAATQPTSVGKAPAPQEQSKPATFNTDQGIQTNVTCIDDSKMKQIKNQHMVLPDGTPLYITVNTPQASQHAVDKAPANSAQSKKFRLKEDIGVQVGEIPDDSSKMTNNQNPVLLDSSPLQFTFNRPSNTYSKATTHPTLIRKIPGCHVVSCPAIRPRMKCCCHK